MLKVVFTLATFACLAAAPQQQTAGAGVLAGRVIDSETRKPVAGASVHFSQTLGGFRYQTMNADANGAFSFTGLAAGRYQVTASSRGYIGGSVGRLRPLGDDVQITLAADEDRGDLTIVLFKSASLSGHVTDEDDQPVAAFYVEIWPRAGKSPLGRRLAPVATAKTDAAGAFQFVGVMPGDYVVVAPVTHTTVRQEAPESGPSPCAPPPPPGMVIPKQPVTSPEHPIGTLYSRLPHELRQPKPRADGTPMTYRTVFYPGVASIAEAQAITLGSGESRAGFDLRMQLAVATTVKGELTSPKGFAHGAAVSLRLLGDIRRDGSDARTGLLSATGDFTFLDVPEGSYVLEPTRIAGSNGCDVIVLEPDSKLTHIPVDVTASGIDGLVVPLATGTSVNGVIVPHGLSRPLVFIDLFLRSLDHESDYIRGSGDELTNTLRIDGVMPGLYELEASDGHATSSWWLEAVTVGGRDVTGLPLAVGAAGVDSVVLTLTEHPSAIRGTVNTSTNQPVADATVVLFPVNDKLWQYARVGALRFQTSRALRGVYEFENVPAGDYYVAALDELTMDAWPEAKFLEKTTALAKRVTVKSGSAQTIWLTMSPAVRR